MHTLALTVVAAITLIPAVALADTACSYAPGTLLTSKLVIESGSPHDVTLQLPGGTAEYMADSLCTVLAFTGLRNGETVYTDDGLGRGLTVTLGKNGALTVTHAVGWISKSE